MLKLLEINDKEPLAERINRLRIVLNEMCCSSCEHIEEEKFFLSRHLDQLICEYMRLQK